jgi:hypothetical protein
LTRALRWTTALAGAAFLCAYLGVALSRIAYPFELEKMEGGFVDHAMRVLAGKPLYPAPSIEFVPCAYTPLYALLGSALCAVLGAGFFPLRLLSFAASLGSLALIYAFVARETRDRFCAACAACLFAATYAATGAWLDIARVDTLFLFLILAALHTARFRSSSASRIACGVLVGLAFLTKQTALVVAAPVVLFCLIEDRRKGAAMLGAVALIAGGSTYLLDAMSAGWYSYYVFFLQSRPLVESHRLVAYWARDVAGVLPIAALFGAVFLATCRRALGPEPFRFYLLAALGTIVGTWPSRISFGQEVNVLFPAYAMVGILFGLGLHAALRSARLIDARGGAAAERIVYAACLVQLAALVYNPLPLVPSRADAAAGRALVAALRACEGDVLMAHHGYLPVLAGKTSHAHGVAVSDIMLRDRDGRGGRRLVREFEEAIRSRAFGAIVLDTWWWFQKDIDEHYVRSRRLFDDKNAFWPVTGARSRPEWIYVPK